MSFFEEFKLQERVTVSEARFDVRDFGAAADGITINTEAFRKAICACAQEGGGHVIVPKGHWLTGPIHLKDNVDFHVEKDCVIEFVADFEEYLPVVYGYRGGVRCYSVSHFLYAHQKRNISITGEGIFEGHGEYWWPMAEHMPGLKDLQEACYEQRPVEQRVYDKKEDGVRPEFVQLVDCENVFIEGVTFQNSPSWTVHPVLCRNVIIRGIHIRNPFCTTAPNTDGIDVESCNGVLIEDCLIETGDDVVCIKAGRNQDAWAVGVACENVLIRNCVGKYGCGGATIGSETSADVRNICFQNCVFEECAWGIRMKTRAGRGGVVEKLHFEDITITKAREIGISLTLFYDENIYDIDKDDVYDHVPEVRKLSLKHIDCSSNKVGLLVAGLKNYELKELVLEHCKIKAPESPAISEVSDMVLHDVSLEYVKA